MNTLLALYQTMKADYLERVRSYGFLIVLLITLFTAYFFVPATDANYLVMKIGAASQDVDSGNIDNLRDALSNISYYRGVYNSAWIGAMVALPTLFFLGLFGFYLVKNSIDRDRRTGVGQIVATTPLSKPLYTLGKTLSNFAVLTTVVFVMMIGALAMQLIRGEVTAIDPWGLAAPFIILCLPLMAIVSATAVLFESIGFLRGSIGNVAYFFVYLFFMTFMILASVTFSADSPVHLIDAFGTSIVFPGIEEAAHAMYPDVAENHWSLGYTPISKPPQVFEWSGVAWTPLIIASRMIWVIGAIIIALIASVFFDRFDSSAGTGKTTKKERIMKASAETAMPAAVRNTRLTPISAAPKKPGIPGVLVAEMGLLLKGQKWWWYAGALVIIVAGIAGVLLPQADFVTGIVLPAAVIWPLFVWSSMGSREKMHNTGTMVFSAPDPLRVQLPATYVAGVLVGLAICSGVIVSLTVSADLIGLAALGVGILFIPAMALAMGIWSGTGKLFEAVYLTIWYIGPLQKLPLFDYVGATADAIAMGVPVACLILIVLLLALAVAGRQRQIYV